MHLIIAIFEVIDKIDDILFYKLKQPYLREVFLEKREIIWKYYFRSIIWRFES